MNVPREIRHFLIRVALAACSAQPRRTPGNERMVSSGKAIESNLSRSAIASLSSAKRRPRTFLPLIPISTSHRLRVPFHIMPGIPLFRFSIGGLGLRSCCVFHRSNAAALIRSFVTSGRFVPVRTWLSLTLCSGLRSLPLFAFDIRTRDSADMTFPIWDFEIFRRVSRVCGPIRVFPPSPPGEQLKPFGAIVPSLAMVSISADFASSRVAQVRSISMENACLPCFRIAL